MPERFDLSYQDGSEKKKPIVVHRAILGSLERFIAILLENSQGWLPIEFSLVQAQVIVLNKNADLSNYINEFKRLGVRYEIKYVDNINQGIKAHYQNKVPFSFILGNKELANSSLVVKSKENQESISLDQFESYWSKIKRF